MTIKWLQSNQKDMLSLLMPSSKVNELGSWQNTHTEGKKERKEGGDKQRERERERNRASMYLCICIEKAVENENNDKNKLY